MAGDDTNQNSKNMSQHSFLSVAECHQQPTHQKTPASKPRDMTDLLTGTATATDCIASRTSASVCKVQTQSRAALIEPVLTNSETRKKAALVELHSLRHQDKSHIGRGGLIEAASEW